MYRAVLLSVKTPFLGVRRSDLLQPSGVGDVGDAGGGHGCFLSMTAQRAFKGTVDEKDTAIRHTGSLVSDRRGMATTTPRFWCIAVS